MRSVAATSPSADSRAAVIQLLIAELLIGSVGVFVHESGQDAITAVLFRCVFGVVFLLAWGWARGLFRGLLGERRREDATDFTSGLLIGADVSFGLAGTSGDVCVMGRPELTRLYAAAIDIAGRHATEIDGEAAFLAGIKAIAGRI